MDICAPIGPKAIRNLAKDDGGPDFALGYVVGGWHAPVSHEDEELCAPCFNLCLQYAACRMCGGFAQQSV